MGTQYRAPSYAPDVGLPNQFNEAAQGTDEFGTEMPIPGYGIENQRRKNAEAKAKYAKENDTGFVSNLQVFFASVVNPLFGITKSDGSRYEPADAEYAKIRAGWDRDEIWPWKKTLADYNPFDGMPEEITLVAAKDDKLTKKWDATQGAGGHDPNAPSETSQPNAPVIRAPGFDG